MSSLNGPPTDGQVAIAHDFFVQDGGAERCALQLARLLPRADVYTSFFDKAVFGGRIDARRVHPWPLQRLMAGNRFRGLLPLYPVYFSLLDLRHARLVISSSVAFAKAVRTAPRALHVSYVYTPLRYAWDIDAYLRASSYPPPARLAARLIRRPLIAWDRRTARNPDVIVAISEAVRERIRIRWGREAEVIYPPVEVSEFTPSSIDEGFLLVAARLLAYRRIDIAVAAATALGRELVVVGDGPERRRLQASAGPTVRFLGHLPRRQLVDLFERCHAYVLPGEEDFGIAPVEAMASGKPVVALGRGGALETVVDGITGVLFADQSVDGLIEGIDRVDRIVFDRRLLRRRAEEFAPQRFLHAWATLLARLGVDPDLYTADPDTSG